MPALDYLPRDVNPNDIRATLALVSDTHMPQRLAALPPVIFDVLAGCDLLLHAGDVGELFVLDQLSAIAPVVAVHGNDDTPAAQTKLPLQQIVAVQGQRVLLWHSHFADPVAERDSRMGDEIAPKLQRTVDEARACGASLAVFGHWHIPLAYAHEDVLVVNPGALASANELSRNRCQTVAIAWLLADDSWRVAHVALAQPDQMHDVSQNLDGGFMAVSARYSVSILHPGFVRQMPLFKARIGDDLRAKVLAGTLDVARKVWAGEAPLLTAQDVLDATLASGLLTHAEAELLLDLRAEMLEDAG